ncbi:olfactory receptor 11L1-like [Rhinatrema bivittatum]|uniref:olfactory receptor 11L1-like n=1 Tax=Rhinatrema bivittatum TaxID=194408 RepID=UPI001129B623|nr:olfactory receptor 11L1-like [Rhinatrema bivittatum]
MERRNQTMVTEFILLGFSLPAAFNKLLFAIFLAAYLLTIMANSVIIIVVRANPHLHTPMYFFISNFSAMEIGYTSVTIPKMLVDLATETKTITASGCITQFYFIFFCGSIENTLLAIMAYDRYIAICNPLRYSTIMTYKFCGQLAVGSWLSGCLIPMLPTIWISRLTFCSPNKMDHFFCDFAPLLKLSCTESSLSAITFLVQAWFLIMTCFLLTLVSYIYIICSVLKIPSTTGRQKAFSTCASHLMVVSIFYGTIIFMYVRPSAERTSHLDKVVSVFYSVVTPLLNPIIYSLRNKDMKKAVRKAIKNFQRE